MYLGEATRNLLLTLIMAPTRLRARIVIMRALRGKIRSALAGLGTIAGEGDVEGVVGGCAGDVGFGVVSGEGVGGSLDVVAYL